VRRGRRPGRGQGRDARSCTRGTAKPVGQLATATGGRGCAGGGGTPTWASAAGGGEGRKRGPCNNRGFSQGKKTLAGAEEKSID
jgi:hypothetical protein